MQKERSTSVVIVLREVNDIRVNVNHIWPPLRRRGGRRRDIARMSMCVFAWLMLNTLRTQHVLQEPQYGIQEK